MRSRLAARRRGLQRPTLSLWTCFRAPLRSSRWIGLMSPASLELRNSMSGSLAVQIPSLNGGSCHFSVICIRRSPDPGNTLFPPTLLMRQPLTSPTSWVLWSRVTPDCQWSRRLWPPTFHPLWCLPGSPAPSFLPSRVGPLLPLSEIPTVLHTMAILQAYQADILKEMDEGTGLIPEAMKELRRSTDLALRATKHTARTSVAAERHLWLNLTEIREKEKVFFAGRTHFTIWVVWGGS